MRNTHHHIHADILRRFAASWPPGTIRWVLLKDQLVTCDLRIRLLAESFEPLVVKILEYIKLNESCSLSMIADGLGCTRSASRRVIAEMLHVLLRAEEVNLQNGEFRCAVSSKVGLFRSLERVIEVRVKFLQRSGEIGVDIPYHSEDAIEKLTYEQRIEWWEPPNGPESHEPESLAKDIERACLRRGRFLIPPIASGYSRWERLQRSQLIVPTDRIIGCAAISPAVTPFWTIRRCYLFKAQTPSEDVDSEPQNAWRVHVYRYPQGGEEEGYSLYFDEHASLRSPVIESLVAASKALY